MVARRFIAVVVTFGVAAVAAASCSLNTHGEMASSGEDASVGDSSGYHPDTALADQSKQSDVALDQKHPDANVSDVIHDTSGCFPGTKNCGECVVTASPEFGCAPETCTPCSIPNGHAVCSNEACAVGTCDSPFKDCNGQPNDGCETPVNTLQNCGNCGTLCQPAHATGTCGDTQCKIGACDSGWSDCDGLLTNGCEVDTQSDVNNCASCGHVCQPTTAGDKMMCKKGVCAVDLCAAGSADCDTNPTTCETITTSDVNNCGACGHLCSYPNAIPACATSVCVMTGCSGSFGDCDNNSANGCEVDLGSNPWNCGACGGVCSTAHGSNPACGSGLCLLTCDTGFANCNGPHAGNSPLDDGCEINLASDANNCGACGGVCSTANGTNPSCSSGLCSLACSAGYADCDGPHAGNASNGCEINITNNPAHCGSCSIVCSSNNGTPGCLNGACTITCNPGYQNCDGDLSNGCEVNTAADTQHCGSCSNVCSQTNGTASCVSGSCAITCSNGWGNCDGAVANGCETNVLTDLAHCGNCQTSCGSSNANATCTSGACVIVCNAGFGNCDGNASNGCEVNLLADVGHCGTCSSVCGNAHATPSCTSGACSESCNPSYGDCDGNAANGCEVNFSTDPAHCGSCAGVCSSVNGTPTCSGSTCGINCASGWGNCDGNAGNGCETATTSDPSHCGSCNPCNLGGNPHGTAKCTASVCGVTCDSGFGNCSGGAGDGCEANLTNDPAHCGNCATACNKPSHTDAHCAAGTCGTPTCTAGYGNCNNSMLDGCEVNLNTSTSNCGNCGNACAAPAHTNPVCSSGSCGTPTCQVGYGDCNSNMHA